MRQELKSLWFVSMKMSSVETVAREIISEQMRAVVDFCPAEPHKRSTGVAYLTVQAWQALPEWGEGRLNDCWKLAELLGAYLPLCFTDFFFTLLIPWRCLN